MTKHYQSASLFYNRDTAKDDLTYTHNNRFKLIHINSIHIYDRYLIRSNIGIRCQCSTYPAACSSDQLVVLVCVAAFCRKLFIFNRELFNILSRYIFNFILLVPILGLSLFSAAGTAVESRKPGT